MGNRHIYEDHGKEVATPRNASDVKDRLAEAMAAIRAGKMNPKLATSLGYLGSSLLKAIEVADLEQRLKRLEESNGGPPSPSQAAGKAMNEFLAEVGCICFPPDEPPQLRRGRLVPSTSDPVAENSADPTMSPKEHDRKPRQTRFGHAFDAKATCNQLLL